MKALKIVGGILLTLVAAVAILWFALLSPPSAESVCSNMSRIMKQESGIEMPSKLQSECIAEMGKEPRFGRYKWVKQLKCMRDAKTSKELDSCGKASAI